MRVLDEIPKQKVGSEPTKERKIVEKALALEAKLKGENYHNLRYFSYTNPQEPESTLMGPRACFIADFGSETIEGEREEEKQKRIIKIDRENIEGRAKTHFENGCTTKTDFDKLVKLGPEAFKYHISPVVDHWQVEDDAGKMHFITAEKFFENFRPIHFLMPPVLEKYRSIQSLMPQLKEDPLTKKEFGKISSHVIEALSHIDENNIYHRDLSLRNIITNIRNEDPAYESTPKAKFKKKYWEPVRKFLGLKKPHDQLGIEAIVTDFANACYKSHPTIKPQPTMGAKQIVDPLMVTTEKAYDDKTEVYSVLKDFLEMLVGEQFVEMDQISKTGRILETRFTKAQELFDENGVFKEKEYVKAMQSAIAVVPSYAKKFAPVFNRGLSPDDKKRYGSTKEFIRDWNKHAKKDLLSRIKTAAKVATVSTLIGLSALGGYKMLHPDLNLYKVHSGWNKETNEIDNNYVKLNVNIGYANSYNIIGDIPKNAQLLLAPIDEDLCITVSAEYQSMDKSNETLTKFVGRAYIENEEGTSQSFILNPVEPGFMCEYGPIGNSTYLKDVKVPKGTKEGTVRNLVLELYAPADTGYSDSWNSEKQKNEFTPRVLYEKNKLLVRKKIHLIAAQPGKTTVADPSIVVDYSSFENQLSYPYAFYFNALLNGKEYIRVDKDLKYIFRIPELGVTEYCKENPFLGGSSSANLKPNLPNGPSIKDLTMQMIVYKTNKSTNKPEILSQSFLPMKRESIEPRDSRDTWYSSYDRAVPDTSFMSKVKKYSRDAEGLLK